jgi:hypothetical protein
MAMIRYLDPARPTRRWITAGLVFAGAASGTVAGLALTVLGKIASGAPPADLANYLWNAGAFGVMGAAIAPTVTWAVLRRAPLWRVFTEPLLASVAGAALGFLLGSATLFLVLTPVGTAAAIARLHLAHRPTSSAALAPNPGLQGTPGSP